jgi:hypothetical protein
MLTDTLIRKTKTRAKPTKLADERGLSTRAVGWPLVAFQISWRQRELLSLGTYPGALAKAREARDAARRTLADGIDPSAARQQEKRAKAEAAANDFESVAREWLDNVKSKWAPVYHGDTLKRFEADVFPAIGRRPIADVAAPELLALLRKIEARGTVGDDTRWRARAGGFTSASRRPL